MKIKITGDFNVLIEFVEAQPKSVTNLEANYMSGNVELAWENPTERTDDTPLPVEEIGEIWIDARQEEIPDWTRRSCGTAQAGYQSHRDTRPEPITLARRTRHGNSSSESRLLELQKFDGDPDTSPRPLGMPEVRAVA
jgi:hypothetical protein